MGAEKFANLAETTLASSYTSGGSSISVASAVGFPSAGPFRVRLGNGGKTIFRVDSVSGTTFTGAAEANDANAGSGDSVKIVATRAVAERFIQTPDAGEIQAYAGVSGADRYGPLWKLTPLDQSGWAWVNQGGAAVTQSGGVVLLTGPSNASDSFRIRKTSAPGTPYSVTALVRARYSSAAANQQNAGICFRDGTGKLYVWYVSSAGQVQAVKWTNETTFSAVGAVNLSIVGIPGAWHWLRLTDDGTNLKFLLSLDGVHFKEYGSEGRTAFFGSGPTEYGIHLDTTASSGEVGLSVASLVAG